MKNYQLLFAVLFSAFALSSCNDPIDLDLKKGETELVVEALLDNRAEKPDTIHLKWTADYFSNKPLPKATGATVKVTSGAETYIFAETAENSGKYVNQQFVGVVGKNYTVNISNVQGNGFENEVFTATSELRRVPPIDSLVAEYKEDNGLQDAGYFVKYYGPESQGVGDFYRFKVYVNDTLLNQPSDLSFSNDKFVDGNYITGIEMTFEPIDKGKTVRIETISITEDHYKFYNELTGQIFNGGLFSPPFSNVRTNLINVNPNSAKRAVGYFGCGGVSDASVVCGQ